MSKPLTGTVSQVLLIDRSLLDDWSYDRVMLQLLGTAGTVGGTKLYYKRYQCRNMQVCCIQSVKHEASLLDTPVISSQRWAFLAVVH